MRKLAFLQAILVVDNPSINQNTIALLDSINFSIVNEIKKRRLYEKTQYNLYHDNLSGLLNRNSFTQFLSYENSAVYSQGVILADINGLKEINRDFGHYHGDKIITIISSIMNSYFPSEKIFRLSGDEFIIIVNNLEYNNLLKLLSRWKILYSVQLQMVSHLDTHGVKITWILMI